MASSEAGAADEARRRGGDMLSNIDKLKAEMHRLRRYERRIRFQGPDGPAILVRIDDVVHFDYDHEPREVTIKKFCRWGIRGIEAGSEEWRSFRYNKIGKS